MKDPCGAMTRLRLAVAVSAALVCAPVVAQTSASQSPASADRTAQDSSRHARDDLSDQADRKHPTELATTVVTANKRSQDPHDVAMSVSTINGYHLEQIHATDFADYLTRVPGVNVVSRGEGQTQIVMRGVTSGSRQPNASVGTYIDAAPFGSSTIYAMGGQLTPNIDPSDLQRIEVLRGPQGTLYGSNTLGGLIKFVTRPPDSEQFSGHAQVDATSLAHGGNGFAERLMLNVPLVHDKLAVRANAYRRNDPGYINDIGKGVDRSNEANVDGGRLQMLWTPTDGVSLRLSGLFQNLHSDGLANGGVDVDPHTLQPIYGRYQAKHPPGTGFLHLRYRQYYATLKADFGWAQFVETSSYGTLDYDQNFDLTNAYGPILSPMLGLTNAGFSERTPIKTDKFTQEVRLQSPSTQQLEWRIGLYYTHEHSRYDQSVLGFDADTGTPIALPPLDEVRFGPALFTEEAAYGDITYHFTPRFDVQLGARYTRDKTRFTQTGHGLLVGPSDFTITGTDHPTTYLVSPEFKISDDVMVYARAASGFRPGGPNLGVPPGLGAPLTFGPDKLINYEVGLKTRSSDRRMSFNVDAFYIDWKQIQLETTVSGIGFLSNGGKAKSQGVEAAWEVRPVEGLLVSVNAAYTDAELTGDTPPGLVGHKGDRLPYVPRFSGNVGIEYDYSIGGGWSGYVGGNYDYVGSRMTNFQSVPNARYRLPSYGKVDLRAGFNYGHWSFGAYVKNATDSDGITLLAFETTNPTAAPYSASYIQPRLIGITASVDF